MKRRAAEAPSASDSITEGTRRGLMGREEGGEQHSRLASLPNVLLHDIFLRLLRQGYDDAGHLSVCSRGLLLAFRTMPALDFTKNSRRGVQPCLEDAITSIITSARDLQHLRLDLLVYDSNLLWMWLRRARLSLRSLEILQNARDETEAIMAAFSKQVLPSMSALALPNGNINMDCMPNLTSLTFTEFLMPIEDLQAMLQQLSLLKYLGIGFFQEYLEGRVILIRHASLEELQLYSPPSDGVSISLQLPALRRLCLSTGGTLCLWKSDHLQSVHIECVDHLHMNEAAPAGQDTEVSIFSREGPKEEFPRECFCKSTGKPTANSSGSFRPAQWISVEPGNNACHSWVEASARDKPTGNMEALFARASECEYLRLRTWMSKDGGQRVGPFPRLKELDIFWEHGIVSALVHAGNFPELTVLTIGIEPKQELKRSDLVALEVLLAEPKLQSMEFVGGTKWERCTPLFLQWLATMGRFPKIHIKFEGADDLIRHSMGNGPFNGYCFYRANCCPLGKKCLIFC